jgi:hypothetical protein
MLAYILIGRRNIGRSKTGRKDQDPLIRNAETVLFLAADGGGGGGDDDDDYYYDYDDYDNDGCMASRCRRRECSKNQMNMCLLILQ